MSVVCSICQEFLTERPQTVQPVTDVDEAELRVNIALVRCGHIFHKVCLSHWFRITFERNQDPEDRPNTGGNGNQVEGRCPCCKEAASLLTALRVFPTGDEDSDTVVQQKKTLKELTTKNQNITMDLTDIKQLLEHMETDLEKEIVAHDLLKMEYGQMLSKMHALQVREDQLKENLQLTTALENSLTTVVDKLGKEKAAALQENQELKKELDALKLACFHENKENITSIFHKGHDSLQESANNQGITKAISLMVISRDNQTTDDRDQSPSSTPT